MLPRSPRLPALASALPRVLVATLLGLFLAAPVGARQAPPGDPPVPPPAEGERDDVLLPESQAEPPPLPPGAEEREPVVTAVEIRSDAPLQPGSRNEVRQLVALEPGERLTEERVGRTLRNLQASGLASRVEVLSRPAPEGAGVVAVVVLRANVQVTEVRVEGDPGEVDRERLVDALFQRAGEPLIESRLVRGVYRLQEILEEEGYFEARVRLAPEVDEEGRRAVVVYRVEAGPRATVGAVRFEGERGPFTADELRQPLRLAEGAPFRRRLLERDAERLESWLLRQGHRAARVEEPSADYRPEDHRVTVTLPLRVGPEVKVRVEGAERERLRKNDLLPILGDEGYDEALLLLTEERVRRWYQERGHYDVEVGSRQERRDGVLEVVLEVEPGPVYRLQELRLEGNERVSDERLRQLMATSPAGPLTGLPLVGTGGRLVQATLSEDLDNLRSFYALHGYTEAKVGPPRVERRDGGLSVTVPIEEGPRQKLVSLDLRGVEALDVAELRASLPLQEGGAFHPRLLEDSLNRIRARYDRQGYDSAQVSGRVERGGDGTLVAVTVEVLEGPQTVVDRVIVRGNRRTDGEVIRRAIELDRGEPVSRSRLLEAERSLYRLGIFSRVSLEITPAPLGATTRDVVVRVEEGSVRSLRYGLSVEYNDEDEEPWSPGGSVGYSHANLFGRAITLSMDARVLSRSSQYRLFVDQPTLLGLDLPTTYSLFRNEERRASFDVTRRGVRMESVRELSDRLRIGLAYDYRIVENAPLDRVATVDDLRREDQTLRVASLIPNLLYDRRDDPLNPSHGFSSLLQLQYAFPAINAEADYLKGFVQHSHYLPLGFGTLAVSARLGAVEPLSPLPREIRDPFIPPGADLPSEDVFLAERFFAGGESSHRAYGRDDLGILFDTCVGSGGEVDPNCAATLFPDADGEVTPAGGNGLALVNVDLRVPVFGAVEGVLFVDSGNVWADWRQIDVTDFRSGVGLEVRYASPVGPLRVGVGFPVDPYEGAADRVFFVSLGAPF